MNNGEFSGARLGRMRDVMAGHVKHGEVPGIVTLVSRRDEVHVDAIGTKAFGGNEPMRRDTIFRVASVTKPIVAAAAMILVEECVLRLDEPVDPWLPELADRRVLRTIETKVLALATARTTAISNTSSSVRGSRSLWEASSSLSALARCALICSMERPLASSSTIAVSLRA
jgi:CubicO group peptidase (beta-lactamase class C family)